MGYKCAFSWCPPGKATVWDVSFGGWLSDRRLWEVTGLPAISVSAIPSLVDSNTEKYALDETTMHTGAVNQPMDSIPAPPEMRTLREHILHQEFRTWRPHEKGTSWRTGLTTDKSRQEATVDRGIMMYALVMELEMSMWRNSETQRDFGPVLWMSMCNYDCFNAS